MSIVGLPSKAPVPDEALIALCEQLLADAKTGMLTALYGVAEYHDGRVDHVTVGPVDRFAMGGHLLAVSVETVDDDSSEEFE